MSDNVDANRVKEELEKDTRDVSDLWNEALRRYKGIVGVDLQPKDELRSVEAMVAYGTEQMNNFHKFRHDQKKVDKLRGLLKSNLDYIEKGAQQLISAATPAFPPAAAIGTAFTYMLSACRQVSADYDVVAAFFEDMNSFLQRITILESRLPSYPAYRNCLMDVFTSLLEMCAFATKYIELGRFKKWIMNMISGQDGDLGDARKKMDTSLSRLQSATEYAILGNTEELQRMNADLRENQEMQTRIMESQTRMLENVMEGQDAVRNDLINIQKLLVVFNERRREEPSKQTGTKATSRNKPPTSNRVRSFLPDTISPSHEYRNIKDTFLPDTCTWLFEEQEWLQWVASSECSKVATGIMAISGNPGAGKSHLATAAYDHLTKLAEKDTGSNKCVVHFFFRETVGDLSEFNNAINWILIQIAEQNATLCEKINVQIAREDIEFDVWDWQDIWSKLVKPLFVGSANAHLQIVLDGLDELSQWQTEQDDLFDFLKEVNETADLHVSVLCTTRPDLAPKLKELEVPTIDLTKEKQLPDLKAVIWSHLNNDSNLRKFSRYIKQRISSKLEEKADGLLYAEHVLRRLNTIGREPVVIRLLDHSMPESLTDLYSNIVEDIQHHTTEEQQSAIKWLLEWLAYSYRPLTLAECLDLVKLGPAVSFNLEEELQDQQLAKVIRIADASERFSEQPESTSENDLNLETQQDPDNAYRDDDLPLKFQDRSIRSYFKDAPPGEEGLRTPLRTAHGQMLLLCVSILSGAVEPDQKSLKGYAAENWLGHFAWWLFDYHSNDISDEEKITHVEAFVSIMTNRDGNYATAIEAASKDYEDVLKGFTLDVALDHIGTAADIAQELGDKVSPETLAWANEVSSDRKTAFLQLARAHVINWLRCEDTESALQSYKVVRSVVKLTNLTDLIDEEGSESDSDDSDDDPKSTAEEILGISKAFSDIVLDSNAHLAVALLLEDYEHHDEALAEAQEALSDCTDPVLHFRIQRLIATTQSSLECEEDALQSITECLSYKDVSRAMLREAYVEQGRIQVALEQLDDARVSYEEARLADPDAPMPGNLLQEEFDVYKNKNADAELIGVVKSWKPIERLAWMTWNYDDVDEQHEVFRRASGRIGEQDFMKDTYEEVINLLDTVGAAAPMRYELAISQWRVRGDIEAAKSLLSEVLDSTSTGESYKFTDEDPAFILVQSLLLTTEIIYEQFRASSDRATKAELFAEAKQLTQRPLAHSVAAVKSELAPHLVTLARMARKMGPMQEFQDTLNAAFDECYEALNDGVGWNDCTNLNSLSLLLSTLGGLETEARILFSAQFAELEPEESDDEDEDGEEDDDDDDDDGDDEGDEDDDDDESESEEGSEDSDDELPTDEGDLADNDYSCDGECEPTVEWTAWQGVPMYQCLICSACFLCESCYQKRQRYNEDSQSRGGNNVYCGANHRYIKGPIEGWKGITDGIMSIDGQEPVSFKTWLADLKETKWKEAWNQFWLSEV